MRNKVAIIKGFANLSPRITLAPFERVNADHVVLITALRYPQFVPDEMSEFNLDIHLLQAQIREILKFWKTEGLQHLVSAEYANIVVDRGSEDVRSVEGNSLRTDWFYETVRNYHRHFGQTVIDCEIFPTYIEMDEHQYSTEDFVARLKPHPTLG